MEDMTGFQSGWVFFLSYEASTGTEPWFSDGTEENTYILADIKPGPMESTCPSPGGSETAVDGGYVYFFANDGTHGCEVWRTDGTPSGTELFVDSIPGSDGFVGIDNIVKSGSNLYITGRTSDVPVTYSMYVINLD